jgi:hypothetical protein
MSDNQAVANPNEILMIRRSYASMAIREKEIMQNLVKYFTKSSELYFCLQIILLQFRHL